MKLKFFRLVPVLLGLCGPAQQGVLLAQSTQPVFPGLTGAVLLDSLTGRYRPGSVLPYSGSPNARDTLFTRIWLEPGDSLRCLYSQHALKVDLTQDPTTYVYLNGMSNGMNTEHAYPQSKGAGDGNARSDMHHLFPTRNAVNSARGDDPFGESADAQTSMWYYRTIGMSTMPTVNKDLYSEKGSGLFEPREDAKGEVARAVFYFYTMYKAQANAADPTFFEQQRATLCQWHVQDPVDVPELERTFRIGAYQEQKPNPFVLDCTLPYRTGYCPLNPVTMCETLVDTSDPARGDLPLIVWPNPFDRDVRVQLELPFDATVDIRLLSLLGQEMVRFAPYRLPAGPATISLDFPDSLLQRAWVGLLDVRVTGQHATAQRVVRLIRQ